MTIAGSIVALTETLPVTRSLVLPGLIVDVTTEVEIVIAGVITSSETITLTGVYSPTLEVDSLALYGLSTSSAPETLLAASYPWSQVTTIIYTYDPLFRLTEASYNNGRSFEYTHDAVGNRLSETACLPPAGCLKTEYTYNEANRMTYVGVIPYDWDNNGNLTDDGVYTYAYDSANRLTAASTQIEGASYAYNGLNDRVRQQVGNQVTTYTLDLAAGLTQVLAGGTYTYLYGQGRIAQYNTLGSPQYFLGDALGSVRQLTGSTGSVALARSYEPYGETLSSAGSGATSYGYTGEITDAYTNFVYLRARYYRPYLNQFIQRDPIVPDPYRSLGWNRYAYSWDNPINFIDPSGKIPRRAEIEDRYFVYSCNCGWIDFHHANPGVADRLFDFLGTKPSPPAYARQDVLLYQIRTDLPFVGNVIARNIVVKTNITDQEFKSAVLGIFEEMENIRERHHCLAGPFGSSCFSEEDLTSDLIGFYMSVNDHANAREDSSSWNWLAEKCNFPVEDTNAIEWSLDVFDTYPDYKQRWEEWESPRLVCTDATNQRCNTNSRTWPDAFSTITPEEPSPNGNWWWYRGYIDGHFLTSNVKDIYFLSKCH